MSNVCLSVFALEKRRGVVRVFAEALAKCSEDDCTPLLKFVEDHSIPEPNTGCWLWQHTLSGNNYATITDPRRPFNYRDSHKVTVSRLVCEVVHGAMSDDLDTRHVCDNPPCVNPDHLIPGTRKENTQDSIDRGRYYVLSGEKNGRAKLSDQQVTSIFLREFKGTEEDEAVHYGVNKSILSGIRQGRIWKHITRSEIPKERLWDSERPIITPEKTAIIAAVTDWSHGAVSRVARELCVTRKMIYDTRKRLRNGGVAGATRRNFFGKPWRTVGGSG